MRAPPLLIAVAVVLSLSQARGDDTDGVAVLQAAQIQEAIDRNTGNSSADCAGAGNIAAESFSPVSGGQDLVSAYSWNGLEGASVRGDQLCVDSIDRSIIGLPTTEDNAVAADWFAGRPHLPDTSNPPIDFLGPQIETNGAFAVSATFDSKNNNRALLNLYGRVPVIQDEARREGEALAFGLVDGQAAVEIWDGKSSQPQIFKYGKNVKGPVALKLVKGADSFTLSMDGLQLGTIPDPGVFKSGRAYIGADVGKQNRMCLSHFSVSEPLRAKGKTDVVTVNPFTEIQPDPKGLRSLATRLNLNIGTCVSTNALLSDPDYRTRLAQNFNMVTPENAMKFQFIHPSLNHYAFDDADALVEFAEANHMKIHGHTLVFGEAVPRWVSGGHFTNQQLRQILHDHIMTVVGHFKDKIADWDVLNEPLDDDNHQKQTIWAKALGKDYPAILFKWAHEADPSAKLFINEYGADGANPRADALAALVRKIRASGGHVDGVGLQMHDQLGDFSSQSSIEANMRRFRAMGVEVRISEIDVNVDNPSPEAFQKQAEIYSEALKACLDNRRNCHSYSMWGFEDKYSSLQQNDQMYSPDEGLGHGMIFDQNGAPRPAYTALQNALTPN